MNPNLSLVVKDKGCLLNNTKHVTIQDIHCKYKTNKNIRCQDNIIYINPTLGKEVGKQTHPKIESL